VSETASFAGRRAIVTGGANGIGAAIVTRLASAGATVALLDIEDVEKPSPQVSPLTVDLSDADAVTHAARDAIGLLGGVDILVNCAGVGSTERTIDLDLAAYHRTLAVNLHAPVLLMREAGRHMSRAGYGRVVNITSIHARLSEPGSLAYDVAKAGLEAATRTAAIELATSGVLVNAVAPGFVATRMSVVDGQDELQSEWFTTIYIDNNRLPLRRTARPAEVAETVAWLAGTANTYVTGQVLTVDGGLSARF
jgi:NAD(P)-dependent dehydrogenase (short-subunit alcohol dehydrogenase family)